MIKQEEMNGKENYCWSFKDNGKRFTVSKKNLLFTFKAYDQLTGKLYQSQQVELYKINQKTIEAAFDPKTTSVLYQFMQTSQKDAILRFIIKLQYIATQFKEDIDLKRLQINKEEAIKFEYEELRQQTLRVENLIKQQRQLKNERQTIIEKGQMNSINGPIYELEVKKGKQLLTITGYYLSEVAYYGHPDEQSEDYDRSSLFGDDQHSLPLKAKIHTGCDEVLQLISTKPSFIYGHSFPFVVSTILDLKKQENVQIQFHLANQGRVIITQSMLTIFPVN